MTENCGKVSSQFIRNNAILCRGQPVGGGPTKEPHRFLPGRPRPRCLQGACLPAAARYTAYVRCATYEPIPVRHVCRVGRVRDTSWRTGGWVWGTVMAGGIAVICHAKHTVIGRGYCIFTGSIYL